MKKLLLPARRIGGLKIIAVLAFIFISSFGFSQQLDISGDVIPVTAKGSPENIMAYTPCPLITSTNTTINQLNCLGLINGSSTMTAMGSASSYYYYTWFNTPTYVSMALPPNTTTYVASQARGYWFTCPTNTIITGLKLPTDIGLANQFVYVVKWATAPPAFPASATNYTVLGKFLDMQGKDTIKCGIPIFTGDIIGVLGVRGTLATTSSTMSYAAGGYVTSISGFTTTLYRFINQTDITTNDIGPLSDNGTGSIARVHMFFGSSISLNPSATNLPAGGYVCFHTDSAGCLGTSSITIAPGATITSANSFTNPTCSPGNDGIAMVSPSAGTPPYTYSWSPAGGTSNTATGLAVGNYTCLITDSLGNCTNAIVSLGTCTGLNELSNISNVSIYPNPSSGKFNFQSAIKSDVHIFNTLGSLVYKGQIDAGTTVINLSDQADGIYYVRLKENINQAHFKIIKN